MRTLNTKRIVYVAVVLALVAGCKKEDERCPEVSHERV